MSKTTHNFKALQKLLAQYEQYSEIYWTTINVEGKEALNLKSFWLKTETRSIILFGWWYPNEALWLDNKTGEMLSKEAIKYLKEHVSICADCKHDSVCFTETPCNKCESMGNNTELNYFEHK